MASVQENSPSSSEEADLDAVQQLIFSLGQLRFSLRSLSSMHVQTALYAQKETEMPKRLTPLESSALLESTINEVLSTKQIKRDQTTDECETDEVEPSLSVEDLEIIHKKLQSELDKRKDLFLTSISEKFKI